MNWAAHDDLPDALAKCRREIRHRRRLVVFSGRFSFQRNRAKPSSSKSLSVRQCRFSDACMWEPSTRADGGRPKSACARNRGVLGTAAAATYPRAMGI